MILVVITSLHRRNEEKQKSKRPPMSPLVIRSRALLPPFSPVINISVVAVASGKGSLPCISFTKYLRKGIKKSIPKKPPRREEKNICQKSTCISGYLACNMYKPGIVNTAPATITPDEAPID